MPHLGYTILYFSAIILVLCSPLEASVISFISPEQIKDIGEDVQLACTVDNHEDYSVLWLKSHPDRRESEGVVLAVRNSLTLKDARYSLGDEKNGSTTTYSFKISQVEATDMGTYECQVIVSASEKVAKSVNLLVRHPPVISETLSQKTIIVPEGQNADITCVAEGYPRPRISWKREYNAIMHMGGHIYQDAVLHFKPAHRVDRGAYYCIANNSVGNADQKIFTVEVEFPPTISTPRPKIAQAKFYGVDLDCKVEAHPAPAVSWFKDGAQLSSSGNYIITNTATAFEVTNSVLRIVNVGDNDYGDYYCNATNKMGQAEARIHLFSSKNPDINFPGLIWTNGSPSEIHFKVLATISASILLTQVLST